MFKNDFEEFSHVFSYDPESGELRWKNTPSLKKQNGKIAGYPSTVHGYIAVMYKKKNYKAHRIAWLLSTGDWPVNFIDHIDHNRVNNRMENLRDVTVQANAQNMNIGKRNVSGFLGVCWVKQKRRWRASLKSGGKIIHLGFFSDINDAAAARKAGDIKYGFHKNHGNIAP